jgi:glycerol kinase
MDYILSLDQGTTSSRAIVFDRQGQVVGLAQREFRQSFPQAGWVEHDAHEIWQTQYAVATEVIKKLHLSPRQIAAVGMTNQRETVVLWDRQTGQPVAPAIVWQDRRTAEKCARLQAEGHEPWVQQRTGLLLDAYFSASKLAWLLEHVPGVRARAERGELAFGTVDSWLIWQLTGGRLHVTDASNASRTQLFNIQTLRWDDALLALFDIPASVLPQVVASSGVIGHTEASLFGAALPIAGIAGDQQAATFGQACWRPGMAKNTYGTGCFMLMNTGDTAVPSRFKLLSTVAWVGSAPGHSAPSVQPMLQAANACYALEGSVFMGGATVQWLRDGLQIIRSAEEVEALASQVTHTDDVYLVPAFVGLGAPHWDSRARASLLGMSRGTSRAHIARAALESIALQVADVFGAMRQDSGIAVTELRVDGGACRNNLLMQLQADLLGVSVLRPGVTETTALGAAYLAGLAVGFWQSADEVSAQWRIERQFDPRMGQDERQAKLARWHQAVERSQAWAAQ